MFVPTPAEQMAQHQAGQRPDLLGYNFQSSDDGKFALVEFVFANPIAYHNFLSGAAQPLSNPPSSVQGLKAVPSDGSDVSALATNITAYTNALHAGVPGLQLFERGKVTEAALLAAFRAHKANYVLGSATVRPQ
jgi:hypothetical protein